MDESIIEKRQSSQEGTKTFSEVSVEQKTDSSEQPSIETQGSGGTTVREEKIVPFGGDVNDVDSTAGTFNGGTDPEFSRKAFLKIEKEEIKRIEKEINGNLASEIINGKKNGEPPTVD